VLAAVAAPAAAASTAKPTLGFYPYALGEGRVSVNVTLDDVDGEPIMQTITIEAKEVDTLRWVALFRVSTDEYGFRTILTPQMLEPYSAIRITALVPGYDLLVSQEFTKPV
jgi:hypothetical protein